MNSRMAGPTGRLAAGIAGLAMAALVAGCTERREDPPDGRFRFVHAAPSLGAASFLLEERTQASLAYTEANGFSLLDAGPFDFNVETLSRTSQTNERTVRLQATIVANEEHTFVLYDDGANPSLEEYARPTAEASETEAALELLHAVEGAGPIDIYLEADGADLAAANPRATLAFKEMREPFTVPPGDYRLSVTGQGNPGVILFQSPVLTLAEASRNLLAIFSDAGVTTGSIRASVLGSSGAVVLALRDTLSSATLRSIHAATTAGALDVVVDDNFAVPLHASVIFGDRTGYANIATGDRNLKVTPAGDPGVIETQQTLGVAAASRQTQLIAGSPGELLSAIYPDDNRGIAARARYRLRHGGNTLPSVNFYLAEPGADIADLTPTAIGIGVAGLEFVANALPGDYELVVVANDEDAGTEDTTIVAGPLPVSFAEGRVYEILLLDATAPGTLEIVLTDETFE